ncbi:MAG: hypothetical protein RIF41_28945, partial [Polyangiaceae bacterium]
MEPEQRDEGQPTAGDPLLPEGNPVRLRSLPILVLASAILVVAMASSVSLRVVVPFGMLATLAIVVAALDVMGSFDDEEVASVVSWRRLAAPALGGLLSVAGLWAVLRGSVAGWWPVAVSGVLVTVTFVAVLWCAEQAILRLRGAPSPGDRGQPRWGMGLLVLGALLYLPTLGGHALSDPWETHYGE